MLKQPLQLPDYQRPYKWTNRHVGQLIDDLLLHQSKTAYRLGTVVLHQHQVVGVDGADSEPVRKDIVDGQQRLLSLTMLVHALQSSTPASEQVSSSLLTTPFSSSISLGNLQSNASYIKQRLNRIEKKERDKLLAFLLGRCELVVIFLDDLSEAFQFFDSQNTRGKELEPHDLLKAFHLREMRDLSAEEKFSCIEKWEKHARGDVLRNLMRDYLFRLRSWARAESAEEFNNQDVGLFKGVNLTASTPQYPYMKALNGLDCAVAQYNREQARQWDRQAMHYPFQVEQVLINGKRFFEYVDHYINTYDALFKQPHPVLRELVMLVQDYPASHRDGDLYTKNLFFCVLLYYFDKFGDAHLNQAAELCFLWSYRLRLTQVAVKLRSMNNHALDAKNNLFTVIRNALRPEEVLAFMLPVLTQNEVKASTKLEKLKEKFVAMKALS